MCMEKVCVEQELYKDCKCKLLDQTKVLKLSLLNEGLHALLVFIIGNMGEQSDCEWKKEACRHKIVVLNCGVSQEVFARSQGT